MGETLRLLKEKGEEPEISVFSPGHLASLIAMADRKEINEELPRISLRSCNDREWIRSI